FKSLAEEEPGAEPDPAFLAKKGGMRVVGAEDPPLARCREVFGDRCYLLAELHYGPDDAQRLRELQRLAHEHRVPLVAGNDVHFHIPERMALHDVVTAIRLGTTVAEGK